MTGSPPPLTSSPSPLAQRIGDRSLAEIRAGTIVVLPSITTSDAELARTPAAERLEERLLFTLLLLRHPEVRVVYLTSLAIESSIVDYYLRFVPDRFDAHVRLDLVALGEPGPRALTAKLLARPDAVAEVRRLAGDPGQAHLLCYKVTGAEHRLAAALGLPLDGPGERHLPLGTKSGSRRVAQRAGVAVPAGEEGLGCVAEVERALARMRTREPVPRAALVKLEDGFAGRGNALVALDQELSPLARATATFVGPDDDWERFTAAIDAEGAVVEEFLDDPALVSSCVQLRIAPSGAIQVVSIYDMLLIGDNRQQYSGCRYPADERHRETLRAAALRIARVLVAEGVAGWFGLDFMVDPRDPQRSCRLNEINLRMGGGTHPFWMALLASGGDYDAATGEIRVGGRLKAYVATDDISSRWLVGRAPADAIERIDRAGLAFDADRGSGVTLQFLGAVREFGMLGATCIADTPADAEALRTAAVAALAAL